MACTNSDTASLLGAYELGLLSPEKRQQFLDHLLECDQCFQELYETEPVASLIHAGKALPKRAIQWPDEGIPVRADTATGAAERERGRRRNWAAWASGLAAAAAVAFVVVYLASPLRDGERPRGDGQTSILVVSPAGEVPTPSELRWEAVPGARSYEVRIHTQAGELVWRQTVPAPPATLPVSVRQSLASGETYFWQVDALLPDERRETSTLTPFTIRD